MKHTVKSMHADTHQSEFDPSADNAADQERMEHVINVGNTERVVSGVAGGLLLCNGLSSMGRNPLGGLLKTLLGGFLLYRGASGTCPLYTALGKTEGVTRTPAVNLRTEVVVRKPRKAVYAFWRKLENLPLFMKHIQLVREIDDMRSAWTADMPGYGVMQWDAEIVKEVPGFLIGWQSVEGAPIENAGKIEFIDHGPEETLVKVMITYRPPAGDLGVAVAHLLNPGFKNLVDSDIHSFKERMETMVW